MKKKEAQKVTIYTIFDKVSDGERKFIRSGNEPVKQFEETGAYTIRLKVRDNPFAKKNDTEEVSTDTDAKEDTVQPDNQDSAGNDDNAESNEEDNKQNAFEEYCLWSDTAESDRLLIVQVRPKAEIKAEVTTSSADDTKCTVNVTYNSYDVGRNMRTFKIKKNVEVTDNGKIII